MPLTLRRQDADAHPDSTRIISLKWLLYKENPELPTEPVDKSVEEPLKTRAKPVRTRGVGFWRQCHHFVIHVYYQILTMTHGLNIAGLTAPETAVLTE